MPIIIKYSNLCYNSQHSLNSAVNYVNKVYKPRDVNTGVQHDHKT